MPQPTQPDDEMKFMFVPFKGTRKTAGGHRTEPVSQQQHAAREYHRRARLRQAHEHCDASRVIRRTRPRRDSNKLTVSKATSMKLNTDLKSLMYALGAGRLDPFDAYCEEKPSLQVHEMLDHALSYQWSVFRFSSDQQGLNELKTDVMKCAMTTPLAWFTVIYAGVTHNAFSYGMNHSPKFNEVLRLEYKDKALRCLMDELTRSGGVVSDAIILSMVTLAAHGDGQVPDVPDLKKTWTTSIFSKAHNLDYYGGMDTAWAHMNALQVLVENRGGLHMIKMKAAAISVQLYDVFTSWRLLSKPRFPLLQPTAYFMDSRNHEPDPTATALRQQMGSAFTTVQASEHNTAFQSLLQSVEHTATLSIDLDQWSRQTPGGPDFVHVQFTRWCILHDLLSLPDLSETVPSHKENLRYEFIRLSTLAYILFTLVPIPEAGDLPRTLAAKISALLDICVTTPSACKVLIGQPGLFQWSVILGGMCAYAAHEKDVERGEIPPLLSVYVSYTVYLSVKMEMQNWPLVVDMLGRYLWLRSECNELGEVFWRFACEQASLRG